MPAGSQTTSAVMTPRGVTWLGLVINVVLSGAKILTALVLSAFLIVAAGQIMWSASSELIDRAPSRAILAAIEDAIRDTIGVRDHHAVRARQIGGKVTMDVHVLVDPDLTVRQGHDIASAVQESVRKADGNIVDINVHVEPWEPR